MPTGSAPSLAETSTLVSVERVWAALESVTDPEIPVLSLREMGILRDVRHGEQGWEIIITPTYSGCPAMDQIEADVRSALQTLGISARIRVQLAPAWTTDWMGAAAREKLRNYGIAPPCAPAAENLNLVLMSRWSQSEVVACPRCGAVNTSETSHFGSTACKALFRCLDCMEPFDHFKPH